MSKLIQIHDTIIYNAYTGPSEILIIVLHKASCKVSEPQYNFWKYPHLSTQKLHGSVGKGVGAGPRILNL